MQRRTRMVKTYGNEETHVKQSIQHPEAPVIMATPALESNIHTHPSCVAHSLTPTRLPSNHL